MDTDALEQSERGRMMPPPPPPPKARAYESSSTDEDDPYPRKPKPRSNLQQPRSREPIYANNEDTPLPEHPVQLRSPSSTTVAAKPPIPPRSSSIVEPNGTTRSPVKHNGSGDAIDNQQYFHTNQGARPVSVDRSPSSASGGLSPRQSGSLPPGISLLNPPQGSPNASFATDNSSSENEYMSGGVHSSSPSPHASTDIGDGKKRSKKEKEAGKEAGDRSSGLMGLFRRKKATQL